MTRVDFTFSTRKVTPTSNNSAPKETTEEFLARGGSVTKCPPGYAREIVTYHETYANFVGGPRDICTITTESGRKDVY